MQFILCFYLYCIVGKITFMDTQIDYVSSTYLLGVYIANDITDRNIVNSVQICIAKQMKFCLISVPYHVT